LAHPWGNFPIQNGCDRQFSKAPPQRQKKGVQELKHTAKRRERKVRRRKCLKGGKNERSRRARPRRYLGKVGKTREKILTPELRQIGRRTVGVWPFYSGNPSCTTRGGDWLGNQEGTGGYLWVFRKIHSVVTWARKRRFRKDVISTGATPKILLVMVRIVGSKYLAIVVLGEKERGEREKWFRGGSQPSVSNIGHPSGGDDRIPREGMYFFLFGGRGGFGKETGKKVQFWGNQEDQQKRLIDKSLQ